MTKHQPKVRTVPVVGLDKNKETGELTAHQRDWLNHATRANAAVKRPHPYCLPAAALPLPERIYAFACALGKAKFGRLPTSIYGADQLKARLFGERSLYREHVEDIAKWLELPADVVNSGFRKNGYEPEFFINLTHLTTSRHPSYVEVQKLITDATGEYGAFLLSPYTPIRPEFVAHVPDHFGGERPPVLLYLSGLTSAAKQLVLSLAEVAKCERQKITAV